MAGGDGLWLIPDIEGPRYGVSEQEA